VTNSGTRRSSSTRGVTLVERILHARHRRPYRRDNPYGQFPAVADRVTSRVYVTPIRPSAISGRGEISSDHPPDGRVCIQVLELFPADRLRSARHPAAGGALAAVTRQEPSASTPDVLAACPDSGALQPSVCHAPVRVPRTLQQMGRQTSDSVPLERLQRSRGTRASSPAPRVDAVHSLTQECERALNCAVALLCQSSIYGGIVQSIAGRSLLPCPARGREVAANADGADPDVSRTAGSGGADRDGARGAPRCSAHRGMRGVARVSDGARGVRRRNSPVIGRWLRECWSGDRHSVLSRPGRRGRCLPAPVRPGCR